MSIQSSEHRSCLLSNNALGVSETILLNGCDVRVRPQNFQVSVGEGSSKTVDDVPLVCNLGPGANPGGDGGDTSRVGNAVFESYDVTSGNSILGLRDRDEGRGSSEDLESTENESDKLPGKHGACLGLASTSELRFPRRNPPQYLSRFDRLVTPRT